MSTYEEAIAAKKQFQGSECLGGTLKIDLTSRGTGGGGVSGGPPMPKRPVQRGGGEGQNGGGYGGQRGGGYGGGRSNACFKCGKDGHKSFECPQGGGQGNNQRGGYSNGGGFNNGGRGGYDNGGGDTFF